MRLLSDLEFSPDGWYLLLTSVLFKILHDDIHKQKESHSLNYNKQTMTILDQTSKTLLAGTAELIANNIRTVEQMKQFSSVWTMLTEIFGNYGTLQTHTVNQAVFLAIYAILGVASAAKDPWQNALSQTFDLWSGNIPTAQGAVSSLSLIHI